jgi:hypothetical protein
MGRREDTGRGDTETRRHGDAETRGRGDEECWSLVGVRMVSWMVFESEL